MTDYPHAPAADIWPLLPATAADIAAAMGAEAIDVTQTLRRLRLDGSVERRRTARIATWHRTSDTYRDVVADVLDSLPATSADIERQHGKLGFNALRWLRQHGHAVAKGKAPPAPGSTKAFAWWCRPGQEPPPAHTSRAEVLRNLLRERGPSTTADLADPLGWCRTACAGSLQSMYQRGTIDQAGTRNGLIVWSMP